MYNRLWMKTASAITLTGLTVAAAWSWCCQINVDRYHNPTICLHAGSGLYTQYTFNPVVDSVCETRLSCCDDNCHQTEVGRLMRTQHDYADDQCTIWVADYGPTDQGAVYSASTRRCEM